MFYALPADTVFEAKERTRRATVLLFFLLTVLYIFFANLMTVTAALMFGIWNRHRDPVNFGLLILITSLIAAAIAVVHFIVVRNKTLDEMLGEIGTRPADPKDSYHAQFINIVQEAEAATGIHGIRAVVLPTPGCNAFSIQDGKGQCAIGATEGLLSKLTRGELSAVVAHEAAHLIHEDSRLVTTACFLFIVFQKINEALGNMMAGSTRTTTYGERRNSGGVSGVIVVLWIISGLGYLATKLVGMAISREREYLADADGVQMCKDPLSLAESLYRISRRYRGEIPNAFSAVFIMNPQESDLDEQEGFFSNLFSDHPPAALRLKKLLTWAKADAQTMMNMAEQEDKIPAQPSGNPSSPGNEGAFMAFQNNQWVGPYSPLQLLTMGFMTPSTWVCPAGDQQVVKASDSPELLPLFQKQVQGAVAQEVCPRCKVPMLSTTYEGAEVEQCSFCKGYLLRTGVLERLITREERTFSPEEIKKAKVWRDSQVGPLGERDHFPPIKCPFCQSEMCKGVHSLLTQVIIDHCSNDLCGAIWCDGGELETIQMLIEDAHSPSASPS